MGLFNKDVMNDFSKDNGSIILFKQIDSDNAFAALIAGNGDVVRKLGEYYASKVEEYNEKRAQMLRELYFSRPIVEGVYNTKGGFDWKTALIIGGGIAGVGLLEAFTKLPSKMVRGTINVVTSPFKESEYEKEKKRLEIEKAQSDFKGEYYG